MAPFTFSRQSASHLPTTREAAELGAEIDRMLAEIDPIRVKMRPDDVEINLSQERTQAILADLQSMFQQW